MFGVKGVPVPAGAERVAEELGSRLVQRGHQVTIYVRPHYTPRSLREYKGMRLVHLPSIATKHLDAITHSFLACLAATASDSEIIHIHGTGSSVFAWIPRLFGKRTIVQSHGLDWQRAKWGRFARLCLRFTDYSTVFFPNATTAVSQKMTAHYRQISDRPVVYIPNGVAARERRSPDLIHALGLQGNDYILFAARLVPEKRAGDLIEAYQCLHTSLKLVLVGDSSYGDAYGEQLKQYASQNILFPGFLGGPLFDELLSNAYCFVLPSDIEGLSVGLIEAMSFGNCVLVSDIEENLEVVGAAGLTFKTGDVQDLTEKLADLLSDEAKVQCFRQQAVERIASRFVWERVVDEFEALYCG